MAVDTAGDVFVADCSNNDVKEIPCWGRCSQTLVTGAGLNCPDAVAVDQRGDVFVGDFSGNITEVQTVAVNFGGINVCPPNQTTPAPCSNALTLNYNVSGAVSLGPLVVKGGGDFALAAGSTCTGAVPAGTCTVNVTFAPLFAGLRRGGIEVTNANNQPLASTLLSGIGVGPQVGFSPSGLTTIPDNEVVPYGIAVDDAGNIFVSDDSSLVLELPAGGGAPVQVGTGLIAPYGLATDGFGDVFIADSGNNRVEEVTPAGVQTTVGSGLAGPEGVWVDRVGNVYIADTDNNRVVEVPANGGPQITVPATGLAAPYGVGVDPLGNIYIADSDNARVVELPVGGGPQVTVGSGFNSPVAVAFDAAGDVLVADGQLYEVPAGGGTPITLDLGFSVSTGVAVDGAGGIFNADETVLLLQRVQPPALNFESAAVGTTSSDSPQSVEIQNIGNAPLIFSGLTVGTNFAQVAGSGTPPDCSGDSSLAVDAICNLSIDFTPTTTGAIQSLVTLTDNSLNGNPATQTIPLTKNGGTLATPVTMTVTGPVPAPLALGQTGTFTVTEVDANGNVVAGDDNLVTLSLTGPQTNSYQLPLANGQGTLQIAPTAVGAYTLTATDATNALTATNNFTIVSPSGPGLTATALTITAAGQAVTTVASGTAVTLTATVTMNGAPVTPGVVTFCDATAAICENSAILSTAQLTTAGTATLIFIPGIGSHSYKAVFVGTTAAAAATSSTQSVTVTGTYPTTTALTATGNPGSYTLTSTVVGAGVSTLSPTGFVSIIDQTNSNAVLGTAPLGTQNQAQTLIAATGSPLTTGTEPYAVATGDFNGDGFTDFAVVNYDGATVSVFLGNGDGTFKPQVTYAVGTDPEGIAAADVNGDGKLDLLVTNTGDGTVGVLLGNGDGTFQLQVTYTTVFGSAGIVVADFNHDGKPDIATSNFYDANISVLLGNGDGTFQAQVNYAVGNQPRTLSSGDFNGDGNIDLVVANEEDATASILIGNGDGTFQTQVTYATGGAPQGVAVSDFNSDGKQDLAIGNSADGTVGILLGNGDGTFQTMTTYATGNGPVGVVIADFNRDGKADAHSRGEQC